MYHRLVRSWPLIGMIGVVIAMGVLSVGCSGGGAYSPAPVFDLTDHRGQSVSLGDQRGRIVLLTFLYTHCPDTCPLFLFRIRQVLADLKVSDEQVSVVVVTVDPERDTVDHLKRFAGSWPANWYYLTGHPLKVARVWNDYEVYVDMEGIGGLHSAHEDYGVIHSAKVAVVDREGSIAAELVGEWSAKQLSEVVGGVLAGDWVTQRTALFGPLAGLLQRCGEFASSHPATFVGLVLLIMLPGLALPVYLLRTFLSTNKG